VERAKEAEIPKQKTPSFPPVGGKSAVDQQTEYRNPAWLRASMHLTYRNLFDVLSGKGD
jgi:hypothetical protein